VFLLARLCEHRPELIRLHQPSARPDPLCRAPFGLAGARTIGTPAGNGEQERRPVEWISGIVSNMRHFSVLFFFARFHGLEYNVITVVQEAASQGLARLTKLDEAAVFR
jgi:hypothetical protein